MSHFNFTRGDFVSYYAWEDRPSIPASVQKVSPDNKRAIISLTDDRGVKIKPEIRLLVFTTRLTISSVKEPL